MKTFKHGGGGGDMLYGLSTMKVLGGGELYLRIDIVKKFYKTLLESQSYIESLVYSSNPPNVDYDLDLFRQQHFNEFTLIECHAKAFNLKFDFTLPWLQVDSKPISEIVINDTGRLRWGGCTIDWSQLNKYKEKCVFIGLKHEYENFIRDRMYVDFYEIKDCLEFAQIIKGSKLYVGNQSTGLALAEGLKVNRIADLYEGRSKQYPYGENGHYKLSTDLIEKYLFS